MRIDTGLIGVRPGAVGPLARSLEELGYDGGFTAETAHDPFFPLVDAARSTDHLQLETRVAIAFARSPMTVASIAYDLHSLSSGRFRLGLGSQVKSHIERRYSMPWSSPVARMREFILALRAIWACWNGGSRLDFRGDFYRHTLMTPFFDPGPNPFGNPAILVGAVGQGMAEMAGEVGDGVILHGFTTERYVREVTVPAITRGLGKSGRDRAEFDVCASVFVITGNTPEEFEEARSGARQQIAFYASTPGSYRRVLDLHGWGEIQTDLHDLAKRGQWTEMGACITDEMLEAVAVVAPPDEVAARVLERYGDVLDRVAFYSPYSADADVSRRVLAGFQHAQSHQ
jgi:probable F420-dependent oxidoreductase